MIRMENATDEFKQINILCLIDNVVVANISNIGIHVGCMQVFLPEWELLLKIFQSPNHKFMEYDSRVVEGSIWNGEEFIAPDVEETPNVENNTDSTNTIEPSNSNNSSETIGV